MVIVGWVKKAFDFKRMSIKLRRQEECEQIRTAAEKMERLSDIFM